MNNDTATNTASDIAATPTKTGATPPQATHVIDRIFDFIGSWWPPLLREEIAHQKAILTNCHVDWAEDHTHLQNLCRAAGATECEVEGDSYGVPGIMELSDLLCEKLFEKIMKASVAPAPKKTKRKSAKKVGKPVKSSV